MILSQNNISKTKQRRPQNIQQYKRLRPDQNGPTLAKFVSTTHSSLYLRKKPPNAPFSSDSRRKFALQNQTEIWGFYFCGVWLTIGSRN
jgi:hypothetical protein